MPAQVIITEPARNIVQVTTTSNTVAVTENINTVTVSSTTITGGGSGVTTGVIDITNTIGDAIAGEQYPQGTTLETIIKDIVAPFFEPAFVSISYNATNSQASGNDLLVECGVSTTISSISLVWSNPENLDNNTDLVLSDQTAVNSPFTQTLNIANYNSANPLPVTLNPTYTVPISTTPVTRVFRATTGFLGNDGTGSAQTLQKDFNIFHRHKFLVVAASLNTLTSISQLLGHSDTTTVLSSLAVDPTSASQSISVNATADTSNTARFTWILIANSGTLGEVAAEINGRGVADYTESFVEFNNGGSFYTHSVGSASPSYRAYRSIQPGAFDSDVTLNIEIKH